MNSLNEATLAELLAMEVKEPEPYDPSVPLIRRIAMNIRGFRKAARMSQEELAVQAGLSPEYLSLVEGRIENISMENLDKIARVLNVAPHEFLQRS